MMVPNPLVALTLAILLPSAPIITITKRVQKELVQTIPVVDNQYMLCKSFRAMQEAYSTIEKNKG